MRFTSRGIRGATVALAIACSAGGARAATLGLVSNNANGALTIAGSSFINTDNGALYYSSGGSAIFDHFLDSTLVSQAHGPAVRVFNFSSLTVNKDVNLTVFGSNAGAFVSSGDILINGSVTVTANGGLGGFDSASALGITGGQVGTGLGGRVDSPCCGYNNGSGGGGGGKASAGVAGNAGVLFPSGAPNGAGGLGGAVDPFLDALSGGGGGGGGLNGYGFPGAMGGAGGGALLLTTATDLTVGAFGSITANGFAGGNYSSGPVGAGGGGAGGALWFDVSGTWTNYGLVSATGGRGGQAGVFAGPTLTTIGNGGAGAGGQIWIDPMAIYNFGIIDLSDGLGDNGNGGSLQLVAPVIRNTGSILGVAPSGTPEPGTWLLMVLGFGALRAGLRQREHSRLAAR